MKTYLLGKASTGKFRFAIVETTEEWTEPEHGYVIQRSYGQVNGKTTLSPKIIVDKTKQKRTWMQQLELQYNSEVKKFKDKGYIEVEKHPNEYSLEELNSLFGDIKTNQAGVIKPQLAKQADKVTNKKIFDNEWMISRKLDGVKALFYFKDGEIHTASRGGQHYDYSTIHIREDERLLKFFNEFPNIILDGEIFVRNITLQKISGAARLEKDANTEWLQYWVYDCYNIDVPDMSAEDRMDFLKLHLNEMFKIPLYTGDDSKTQSINLLEQMTVSGWDNMMKLHDEWVNNGFEGAVIKDPNKPYIPGSRGNQLIKIKNYKSSEFLCVGYELGLRGSEDMCFICALEDGRTFKAMPTGDREIKAEYVANFEEKYKGHLLECTYFNLSDDGIPTQPKSRNFRFDLE